MEASVNPDLIEWGFDLFSTSQRSASSSVGGRARGGRPCAARRACFRMIVMWSDVTLWVGEDGVVGLVTISAHGWGRDLGSAG
jgi:hypothetical protein